jgi:hypothetical protein
MIVDINSLLVLSVGIVIDSASLIFLVIISTAMSLSVYKGKSLSEQFEEICSSSGTFPTK